MPYYSDNALMLEVFLEVAVIATWSYLEASAGSDGGMVGFIFPIDGELQLE